MRSYVAACVPPAEIDDAVADTFVVAWRRFGDVPAERARGWLIGVARNVLRSRRRSFHRALTFLEQLVDLRPSSAVGPAGGEMSYEDLEILKRAFASLSEPDQEILALAGPYELSNREIALALGISTNAVGVRLHRARGRLRDAHDRELTRSG